MITKNVDWSVLAQCDLYAVQTFVETADRPAMKTIVSMMESLFQRKLVRESQWKDTYNCLCSAYQNLRPNFEISHDNFGGYRLVYKGNTSLFPPNVLRRNPVGFVSSIPDGAVTSLSVMSSERTGQQLLLLGPIRFVNSDCSPNCEYDFSSDSGIVQLRVKRKINPGDEILVKYGPNFFEFNECLCRTCELKKVEDSEFAFDLILYKVIEEIAEEFLSEIEVGSPPVSNIEPPLTKRRRIRGRELIEMFNDITSSPLSNECSPVLPIKSFSRFNPYHENIGITSIERDGEISFCTDSDNEEPNETSSDETSSDESIGNPNSSPDGDFLYCADSDKEPKETSQIQKAATDSPGLLLAPLPVVSSVSNCEIVLNKSEKEDSFSECNQYECSSNDYRNYSKKLFEGTDVTVDDATIVTDLFCSRFKFSDECSSMLHSLIASLLPEQNNFPSAYSHNKKIKKNFNEEMRFFKKTEEETVCVMNFRYQLRDIVQKNLSTIFNYSSERRHKPQNDLNSDFSPVVENEQNSLLINLILFADGVNIKKSTMRRELWPIWLQIADLPPKLRMSLKNVVLASLFVGATYPNWFDIVPQVRSELNSAVQIKGNNNVSLRVCFKVRLLVSDLGAKCHILNMFKFNGYYGCHYCTAQGKTIGRTHAYYPYEQRGDVRESTLNNIHVECAETIGVNELVNVIGVKGKNAFSGLIEGLPLSAPVDYMHCVLLGVFPELLKLCYKSLTSTEKIKINIVISNFSCPREMIAYSRKVRPLDEMAQFKANEFFNWLFYISPIIFLNRLPEQLYSHLMNLTVAVRLLFESTSNWNTSHASIHLDKFCSEIVSVHGGNERIETINVHCLRHLVDQVRRFGPLYCYSAMSFESANRSLGDLYSGSHSECEVICRRILQRHKLANAEMSNSKLDNVYRNLSGVQNASHVNFNEEFVETEALLLGKLQYPTAQFFNRQIVKNVYFDSSSYKRSKLGNCFACFFIDNQEMFRQIQYFIQFSGPPFGDEILANVRIYSVVERLGPVEGFFYRVSSTLRERLVSLESLKKVFFCADFSLERPDSTSANYMVKLCSSFEHS